VKLEASV